MARMHPLREALFSSCREQRAAPFASVDAERPKGATADAASRRADGAKEGWVVVGVAEQPQVSGNVLDLRLFEERLSARNQVGNALVA